MTETIDFGPLMLLLGVVALVSSPLRKALRSLSLPGLVGFVGLGVALSALGSRTGLLTSALEEQIEVLAQLGIIALLFRVGLESDPGRVVGQLGRAAAIWLPNMVLPGLIAFALILLWPGFGTVPALLTGVAASATSIGVSVAPWEEAGALDSEDGALLLDVAELDDISAVILLGIVFAVAPALQEGLTASVWREAAASGVLQAAKIMAFSAACFAFSRLVERRLSALFARLDPDLGPFVFAAGTVFLIAALAETLGFSMAIGALFAGLAFSRDPAEHRIDEAFGYLLALFGPFFFLSIGLSVGFEKFGSALVLAAALFLVLVAGKLLGAGVLAWAMAGRRTGRLIGASMVPRAEIYLIVLLHGLTLGAWAMPQELYTAAVLAAVATCIAGPYAVATILGAEAKQEQPS